MNPVVVARYQWYVQRGSRPVPGYQQETRLLLEEDFQHWIRPLVRDQYDTLAKYQFKYPFVTHYAVVRHQGIDWAFRIAGSFEECKPNAHGLLFAVEWTKEWDCDGYPVVIPLEGEPTPKDWEDKLIKTLVRQENRTRETQRETR